MDIETLKTEPPFSKVGGAYNSSSFIFDLPTLVANLKHSYSWLKGELNAMILLNSPGKQIVLTALHKGTEISSFQSDDSITLQIIEGKLRFQTRKESVTLNQGQLLTLHENIKYSLTNKEETVFLLTIAKDIFRQSEN
jgi:quercetin dioxygenase-like cupin family protein